MADISFDVKKAIGMFKERHNFTFRVPKTGIYEVSGSVRMVDGSKNPIEIGLPEGYSINDCIIPWDEDFDQDDGQCKHHWRNYIGFTESFKYCTKCDERREIDDTENT